MISTFFSTSKPIHYLIVLVLLILFMVSSVWLLPQTTLWSLSLIFLVAAFLAVFQFIIAKNELTGPSSYALWIAMLFILSIIVYDVSISMVISQVFIMLALRRLLNLKSGYTAIQKVFDASFWVMVATIFFHWNVLFMLVVFVAVFLYVRNDYRNWITPFIAIVCVSFLLFTYDYVWDKSLLESINTSFDINYLWDMKNFTVLETLLLVVLVMALVGLLVYLSKLIDIQQSVRPRFTILMFSGLIGIAIAIIDFNAFTKGGYLLLIPALSIFIARAAQRIEHKILKELLLWLPLLWLVTTYLAL